MLRRPLHLLLWSSLAVATLTTTSTRGDDEPTGRGRRGSDNGSATTTRNPGSNGVPGGNTAGRPATGSGQTNPFNGGQPRNFTPPNLGGGNNGGGNLTLPNGSRVPELRHDRRLQSGQDQQPAWHPERWRHPEQRGVTEQRRLPQ
jgi:hypothetical protein